MLCRDGRKTMQPLILSVIRDTEVVDFSEMFAASQTNRIHWNGRVVLGLYEVSEPPGEFALSVRSAKVDPAQGVRLKVAGGAAVINGREAADMVMWAEDMPGEVRVQLVKKGRKALTLKVWNVWREAGVTHAWLANAAMVADELSCADTVVLQCNDGSDPQGEPTFDDLVIEISGLEGI